MEELVHEWVSVWMNELMDGWMVEEWWDREREGGGMEGGRQGGDGETDKRREGARKGGRERGREIERERGSE